MATATLHRSDAPTYGPVYPVTHTTGSDGSTPWTGEAEWERERWDAIVDELRRFCSLGDDWDGQGAEAPSPQLVDSTLVFAQTLRRAGFPCPSRVGAGPNGTVLFEWQDENLYLEAEITQPGRAEWMWIVPGQPGQHWETLFP